MKVLVLGANGMLGHVAAHELSAHHEVTAALRRAPTSEVREILAGCRIVDGVDVRLEADWRRYVTGADVVVNCAGIVKQRSAEATEMISVNSLFPHQLAAVASDSGVRIIHVSTDCVFSGKRGDYKEMDEPDPIDLYGRSKLLGEPEGPRCITLRTSMIGLELSGRAGLVEWFLAQRGPVSGFRRAIWSGFTTAELSRVISRLIDQNPNLSGIWHVSSAPINKYDLLAMLNERLGRQIEIDPDDSVVIDRSLNSDRFRRATGYEPPSHQQMLDELAGAIKAREEDRVA